MEWLMQQKQNSPLYLFLVAILAASGVNISKTSTAANDLSSINEKLSNFGEWKAVAEYRLKELEETQGGMEWQLKNRQRNLTAN